MTSTSFQKTLCILILIASLAGCNYPGAAPVVQDTPTALPSSPTSPPPPTELPTLIPPTEAPTLPPATPTTVPPTAAPPKPPTARPSPTVSEIKPQAGARFEGSFDGGTLVLRINANGTAVIPKTIRVTKATCQEGKKLSDTLSFEPPTSFAVEDGQFTITWGTQVDMPGIFTSPTQARGSLELKFKKESVACTIGPVAWVAEAVE
jgi:hypothetical protein